MSQRAREFNFDGLVGPTHNYGGLSFGNIASIANTGKVSNPKLAAKQGLFKMKTLYDLGIPQAVVPPHERPNMQLLRKFGMDVFAAACSAASMWTANMATVSPSCDAADMKLHITPANLMHNLHRSQEAQFSHKLLKKFFPDSDLFSIHQPLLGYKDMGDEGAANHSILCQDYGVPGLELFVYGDKTAKYPARQAKLASIEIMRRHLLDENRCLILQQNPDAIDAGVFHNDVIFVANKNVMFYHEKAFVGWDNAKNKIKKFFNDECYFLEVKESDLSIQEAVHTYIFNSQIVSITDNEMLLIAPKECENSVVAKAVIDKILAAKNPIKSVIYLDLKQSMQNGGGPACLRMRVVLNTEQQAKIHQKIIFNNDLYHTLDAWIDKYYRDQLKPEDLLDKMLVEELCAALEQLTRILDLGSIYPFQQV